MNQEHATALERIEAELARQDAEWTTTRDQILAAGDVELAVDPDVISELEDAAHPKLAGSVPVGLTRV